MTLTEALEKISKALAVLAHQTHSENLTGLFSKNRLSEDLLLPLFQIALAAPNLRNVNRDRLNYPDVDLVDDRRRIAIQVTTERTAAKISSTLSSFTKARRNKRYGRLVFFLLTDRVPRYSAKNIRAWKRARGGATFRFDPVRDILAIPNLFSLIQGLPQKSVFQVAELLAQSVIGERFVDVAAHIKAQAQGQLELEKRSTKYIPDVFVETRDTKSLARSFAHPVLFLGRTTDSLKRINLPGTNRFLAKAGLPPFPSLTLPAEGALATLEDADAVAADLTAQASGLSAKAVRFEKLKYDDPPPSPIDKRHRPFYEANKYHLQNVGWGLRYRLDDIIEETAASRASVFILTGRAGQGKTNFVCDLVERFLWKHDIPCAYLSGRRISHSQSADLHDIVTRLIFDAEVASFRDAAKLLSEHAIRARKPFVLVIDGLNEHHRLTEFALQLEAFIETVLEFPNLKLLLTCRSEYFQQRFGQLTTGSLKTRTLLVEANELRLEDEAYADMMTAYFDFFGVDKSRVSAHVLKSLRHDILLLRFFCEAYGTRNKESDYRQPWIRSIYRDEIFGIYLKRKLGTADAFHQRVTGTPNPIGQPQELMSVLEHVLRHMLTTWRFADVPATVIPLSLHTALFALLDEDLILRRDAPDASSPFAAASDTINFTFDEFRDYLLAQFLLHRVYRDDPAGFADVLNKSTPTESQALEGLKRFLFYGARYPINEAFWREYKQHAWYLDVYDGEVFNIDVKFLRQEDEEAARSALLGGGGRAREYARDLAIRWHPTEFGLLNLELLLAVATSGDDAYFDDVIVRTFQPQYQNAGYSVVAFADFISKEILPKFDPNTASGPESLLRFAILLLPVDAGVGLNSPSGGVLRELLQEHPDYAVRLLQDSYLGH
ncbi:MAG: SMEK domain-containing protein [Vicinamibacterales bacterium]